MQLISAPSGRFPWARLQPLPYFIQNKKRLPLSLENKNLMVVSKTMSTCLD